MFISSKQCSEFDSILKEFEVGLRSFISEQILQKHKDYNSFETLIMTLKNAFDTSNIGVKPLLFQKYIGKITKWLKDGNLKSFYESIVFAFNCYDKKSHYQDSDVPYLSEIIDIMFLLNEPYFTEYIKRFGREFESTLNLYLIVRNACSHPGSRRVSLDEARQIIHFIFMSLSTLEEKYFWYVSGEDLKKEITALLTKLDSKPILKHNLYSVSLVHEQLLMRETEYDLMNQYLLTNRRKSSSVVLHGYGGVGKTALALEFCYNLLDKVNEGMYSYDFICWASSKSNKLAFDRSGIIKIKNFEPQYETFNDLCEIFASVLGCDNSKEESILEYFNSCSQGLIIIDNYENIVGLERTRLENFINECPHHIQFIITSRQEEEIADKRIEINGFKEIKAGSQFIGDYCKLRSYRHEFDQQEIQDFLTLSCGNTLVITLMLDRIIDGIMSIRSSIDSMRHLPNREIDEIAEFMYRNMFDNIISEYELKYNGLKDVLNIILLHREPMDFYSIHELSGIDAASLNEILSLFIKKFIINRINGLYELNEMALKFVSLKLLPDRQGVLTLVEKINDYRRRNDEAIEKLRLDMTRNPKLREIMEDWQPIANSDTLAIAQAYNLFDESNRKLRRMKDISGYLAETEEEFNRLFRRSGHPYISFQKARIYKLFLAKARDYSMRKYLLEQMNTSFEDAYLIICKGGYNHVLQSPSYPALLKLYGMYHLIDNDNVFEAIKYLEISSDIYIAREDQSENAANAFYHLAQGCCKAFIDSKDGIYLRKASRVIEKSFICFKNQENQEKLQEVSLLHIFVQFYTNAASKKATTSSINQQKVNLKPRMKYIIENLKRDLYSA
ncbi:ATP-binding protein [Paenibacillus cineris]|uniref:NB-ARC domain-containing protein n=1 Tax=Paenibacillus cineris TaxID=237530 RepID=A0ABQ4LMG9_9BACL|nr:ATP-binding protein [Paenibacillus cineris]GIO57465.1 hypothetical protein J21TS7_57830 [Paenibacillus cineris]